MIWQTNMFHAFLTTEDLGRQNVSTILNQTMIPFILLNWHNIYSLERVRKVQITVVALRTFFKDPQDVSLASPGKLYLQKVF